MKSHQETKHVKKRILVVMLPWLHRWQIYKFVEGLLTAFSHMMALSFFVCLFVFHFEWVCSKKKMIWSSLMAQIQHCHCHGVDSIPGLGTSACHECSQNQREMPASIPVGQSLFLVLPARTSCLKQRHRKGLLILSMISTLLLLVLSGVAGKPPSKMTYPALFFHPAHWMPPESL